MHFFSSIKPLQSGIEHLPVLKRQSVSCKQVASVDDEHRDHPQVDVVAFHKQEPLGSAEHAADVITLAHEATAHDGGEACHWQRLSAQHAELLR